MSASPLSMKQVWILAWLVLAAQILATETRNDEESNNDLNSDNKSEAERSLKKRQLNFDGDGGGVNSYLNGDNGEYEDYDIEYWTQVTRETEV